MHDTSRRGFLKLGGGVLSASMLPFLKTIPAGAQTPEVAVAVMGQTINSLDIHRTGTNRPSYQIAVNCYDRLVSFGTKETPGRRPLLRLLRHRAGAGRELGDLGRRADHDLHAEGRRRLPGRPPGHRGRRQVVLRPRRLGRRLPDGADEGRRARAPRPVRGRRRAHLRHHPRPRVEADAARPRRPGPLYPQQRAREGERDRGRPLGDGIRPQEHHRLGRLQGGALGSRPAARLRAQRCLDRRAAARHPAPRPARGSLPGHPPRADRAGRRADVLQHPQQGRQGAGGDRRRERLLDADRERDLRRRRQPQLRALPGPRRPQGAGLCDPLRGDLPGGRLWPRPADVGRHGHRDGRLAAGLALQPRHGQGARAPGEVQLRQRASRCRSRSASARPTGWSPRRS